MQKNHGNQYSLRREMNLNHTKKNNTAIISRVLNPNQISGDKTPCISPLLPNPPMPQSLNPPLPRFPTNPFFPPYPSLNKSSLSFSSTLYLHCFDFFYVDHRSGDQERREEWLRIRNKLMKSTSYSGQFVVLSHVWVIVQQKYFAGIHFVDWRFCFLFYPV